MAGRVPQAQVIGAAKAVSDDDVRAAAAYFAALKPRRNIRVLERATLPKPRVAGWFLSALHDAGSEPLGRRIVELPDRLDQFESRDTRATFTAYVPPPSLAAGAALVAGRDGNGTPACAPARPWRR